MNRQGLTEILRLRPAALTSPPELQRNRKDRTMNSQFVTVFDLNSDICEFGLIAAASPEFTDALIRALSAAARDADASKGSCDVLAAISADSV